ncbi:MULTISPECIES: DUF6869 domain-containing protein [unclassified Bradyrhizobium]|uniref:DUF6869 domain-containing protein n=1 Tax=unclassified Bradyrhizobium TaxID=2631580 RepID=UPI0028EB0C05|nr:MULTISPECIES: hypothetical protein [unclassified Bradyrhizobium]
MNNLEPHRLAEAWIKYVQLPDHEAEASDLFSAFMQLDNLVSDQPEAAWPIIQQLWALDHTNSMLAIIAAGPVEDLLCRHGPEFIERIEQLARQDPIVKKMLGAVWGRNRMPEDVWRRLKAVAGPDF